MKYLTDYTQQAQTTLFNELGVFFAFSEKQITEGMEKHNHTDKSLLASFGGGMIAPTDNAVALLTGLENINKEGIKADMAENGAEAVVRRELGNYECSYTGCNEDAVEALSEYPIDVKLIHSIHYDNMQNCDW